MRALAAAPVGLVARLIAACSGQISELTASVLAEIARVADLLRQVPGEFSATRGGTIISLRVRLDMRADRMYYLCNAHTYC